MLGMLKQLFEQQSATDYISSIQSMRKGSKKMDPNDWTLTGNANINPSNNFLGTTDDEPLVLKTNGKEAMRIDPTGKIGIGIADPHTQLHVLGQIATGLGRASSAGCITFYAPDEFAWFHIDNGPAGGRQLGRLRLSYGGQPGEHEIMSLDQHGNVGIGTTTPDATLQLSSTDGPDKPQMHITQTTPNESARLRFSSWPSITQAVMKCKVGGKRRLSMT
jgi:hypothetical protein